MSCERTCQAAKNLCCAAEAAAMAVMLSICPARKHHATHNSNIHPRTLFQHQHCTLEWVLLLYVSRCLWTGHQEGLSDPVVPGVWLLHRAVGCNGLPAHGSNAHSYQPSLLLKLQAANRPPCRRRRRTRKKRRTRRRRKRRSRRRCKQTAQHQRQMAKRRKRRSGRRRARTQQQHQQTGRR